MSSPPVTTLPALTRDDERAVLVPAIERIASPGRWREDSGSISGRFEEWTDEFTRPTVYAFHGYAALKPRRRAKVTAGDSQGLRDAMRAAAAAFAHQAQLQTQIAALRERVARLEGVLQVYSHSLAPFRRAPLTSAAEVQQLQPVIVALAAVAYPGTSVSARMIEGLGDEAFDRPYVIALEIQGSSQAELDRLRAEGARSRFYDGAAQAIPSSVFDDVTFEMTFSVRQ